VFDQAFSPQFPGKRAGKVASALGVSKRNCAYFPRVAGSAHRPFSPSCRRHFFGLRFFICSPGFHPAGADRPTLDHGIPRSIHTFRRHRRPKPPAGTRTTGRSHTTRRRIFRAVLPQDLANGRPDMSIS
jgi:hypothetical protein